MGLLPELNFMLENDRSLREFDFNSKNAASSNSAAQRSRIQRAGYLHLDLEFGVLLYAACFLKSWPGNNVGHPQKKEANVVSIAACPSYLLSIFVYSRKRRKFHRKSVDRCPAHEVTQNLLQTYRKKCFPNNYVGMMEMIVKKNVKREWEARTTKKKEEGRRLGCRNAGKSAR